MPSRELARTAEVARHRLVALAADTAPPPAPVAPAVPSWVDPADRFRRDPAGDGSVEWLVPPDDDPLPPAPVEPAAGPGLAAGPELVAGPEPAPWDQDEPPPGRRNLLPLALRDGLLDPGRRGVLVLAVVAVLVAAIAGVAAWRSRPAPERLDPPVGLSAPAVTASRPAARPVVAVSGRVRRPGLVTVGPGARVADALQAAGGVLPGTDLGMLNLARRVVDGELILVGPAAAGAGPAAPSGAVAAPGAAVPGSVLDLNTATVSQLDGLPGVGPVLAERIVAYRTAQGGFRSVQQLREVDGIGDTRFERLKDLVRV